MKRIYACLAILLAIGALALGGAQAVGSFRDAMLPGLTQVQQLAQAERWPEAATAAQDCLALFRQHERRLAPFVRHDHLAALDQSLCALARYAQRQDPEETLAESARAKSQVRALALLFFRVL